MRPSAFSIALATRSGPHAVARHRGLAPGARCHYFRMAGAAWAPSATSAAAVAGIRTLGVRPVPVLRLRLLWSGPSLVSRTACTSVQGHCMFGVILGKTVSNIQGANWYVDRPRDSTVAMHRGRHTMANGSSVPGEDAVDTNALRRHKPLGSGIVSSSSIHAHPAATHQPRGRGGECVLSVHPLRFPHQHHYTYRESSLADYRMLQQVTKPYATDCHGSVSGVRPRRAVGMGLLWCGDSVFCSLRPADNSMIGNRRCSGVYEPRENVNDESEENVLTHRRHILYYRRGVRRVEQHTEMSTGSYVEKTIRDIGYITEVLTHRRRISYQRRGVWHAPQHNFHHLLHHLSSSRSLYRNRAPMGSSGASCRLARGAPPYSSDSAPMRSRLQAEADRKMPKQYRIVW